MAELPPRLSLAIPLLTLLVPPLLAAPGEHAATRRAILMAAAPSAAAARGAAEPTAPRPARPEARALETARPLPPSVGDAVSEAVLDEMSQLGIPGLSLAVAEAGALRLAAGYGYSDVENDVPAGPETVYRLASVSKPLTAVAALRLAERGQLNLDAPVWRYCDAFPPKPASVTTRQILCHQAGVRHYRPGEQPLVRRFESVQEGLALFKDDALVFEPGTQVLYSTHAYNLLGCVVERVAGRSFEEVLRDEVFGPATMTSTRPDDVRALIPHRAAGYVRSETGELQNSALADMSYKIPGGGLCSTAPDVARFGVALLSGRLVGPPMLQQMFTRQRLRSGRPTSFGLGLTVGTRSGLREAWQTGAQEQVSTLLYLRPDAGLSIALLSNLEGVATPLLRLARRIADLVPAEPAH